MTKMKIRKSACSGTWFSSSKDELMREIDTLFSAEKNSGGNVKAIIVPHAGYAYSGAVAAKAFSQVPKTTKKVVILGTAHHYPLVGASVDDVDYYETPLGLVKLADTSRLLKEKDIVSIAKASSEEHSIEIELPFLQRLLPEFSVVPIIVGKVGPDFADVIDKQLDDNTILVVSVDLSHFHSQHDANMLDGETIKSILSFDEKAVLGCEVDSPYALAAFLRLAKKRGWTARLLDYRTSGDVTGNNDEVVGYSAFAFYEDYTASEGEFALGLARKAVESYVKNGSKVSLKMVPEKFLEKRDVFVTLKANGRLRGCIGTLGNPEPIHKAIIGMAISAAAHDPRFSPVSEKELPKLEYEISILTEPVKLDYSSSQELLAKILWKGVILSKGPCQATYLPQVWEELGEPELFLCSLCEKAGLHPNEWKKGVEIFTYEAIVIS